MEVKDLKGTKIYLQHINERVAFQNKVFELGVSWRSGHSHLDYLEYPLLFIDESLKMSYRVMNDLLDAQYFIESEYRQVFIDDVLSINEVERYKDGTIYELIDKDPVLVRNCDTDNWIPTIFKRRRRFPFTKYPYVSYSNKRYRQCIPFKGNEYLAGTNDDLE